MRQSGFSSKLTFPLAALLLLCSIILVAWKANRHPAAVMLIPGLTGKPEYCLSCHNDLPEISPSHPVETFGCVTCHGGEPLALDADLAHSTMRGGANPSDLTVVQESCGGGDCHSGSPTDERDHIQRVETSLQATYAGAIASVLRTFGAQPDGNAHFGISAVQDDQIETETGLPALARFDPSQETSPSILAFAGNCLSCHLSADPLDGPEFARLTGCAACHTPTAGKDLDQPVHQLTTAIQYAQCNTCHNRGNYNLLDMEFHARKDHPADRLGDYYQPIAQFTRCEYTLDCVDCHTAQEVMGDGDLHSSMAEVRYIQCQTCHGTLDAPPLTETITDPDSLALRRAFLDPLVELELGDTIVVSGRGEPLWNTRIHQDGSISLVAKVSGLEYPIPLVQGSGCLQQPDQQESQYCHVCHAVER